MIASSLFDLFSLLKPGTPYLKERLNSVDLLIKIDGFVKKGFVSVLKAEDLK